MQSVSRGRGCHCERSEAIPRSAEQEAKLSLLRHCDPRNDGMPPVMEWLPQPKWPLASSASRIKSSERVGARLALLGRLQTHGMQCAAAEGARTDTSTSLTFFGNSAVH